MSSMAPEPNAAAGNTPRPRASSAAKNSSGAASRITLDTRDLTKLKTLLTDNVTAAEKLSKQLTGMDPALKTLKSVNAELATMRSLLGMSGGGGGRGGGGSSIANGNAGHVPAPTRQGVATAGRPAGSAWDAAMTSGTASYTHRPSFGTPAAFGTNPADPQAPRSYTQRFTSYMSQPVQVRNNPGARDYAGMSRGAAAGTILATSLVAGTVRFGGSYGNSQLAPNMDRSLLTSRLAQGAGQAGTYSQQQSFSVALNQAYARGSQGFADTTAAGQTVRQQGGGGSYSLAAARSGGGIAALDPSFGAANSQSMAGAITGVRSQNMLRGLGIRVQGTGTAGVSATNTIDQYIDMYERTNRHKMTYDEIESAFQDGYPLNRSISAIFGAEQIPAVVARWHQKNSALVADNVRNNLYSKGQTAAQAQNNLQVTANQGVVAGQRAFLSGKTAAANSANRILKASGAVGQDAIAGAVASGMTLSALSGIKSTLDKILTVTVAQAAGKLGGKLAGKGIGAILSRLGLGGAEAAGGTAAEVGADGAAVAGGVGVGTALGVGAVVAAPVLLGGAMIKYGGDTTTMDNFQKKVKARNHGKAHANRGPHSYGISGNGGAAAGAGGSTSQGQQASGGGGGNPVQRAIGIAESFLGDPYRYGGASPSTSFDCSGLIQYSYGQVGVKLPRTAHEQSHVGQAVNPADIQAGDLIFFAGADGTAASPGHEGMYIGGGKMIQAPHTGANIEISGANLANAVAIRRVANGGTAGSAMPTGTGVASTNTTSTGGRNSFSMVPNFGGGSPDADLIAALGGGRASYSNANPTASATVTTGTSTNNAAASGSAPTNGTGNVALAQKMAATRGWTGAQWNALYAVWQQESGFKTTAGRVSAAYGIPQADPGTKMASAGNDWLTNPATQINWGLDYIATTYGNPAGAQAHKHATDSNLGSHAYMAQPGGWYEQGAWSIVKDQLATLHKGEMVVPQKTANLLRTMVETPGGGTAGVRGGGLASIAIKEMHFHGTDGTESQARKHAKEFWAFVQEDAQLDRVARR